MIGLIGGLCGIYGVGGRLLSPVHMIEHSPAGIARHRAKYAGTLVLLSTRCLGKAGQEPEQVVDRAVCGTVWDQSRGIFPELLWL